MSSASSLMGAGQTPAVISAKVSELALRPHASRGWLWATLAALALTLLLGVGIAVLLERGVGIWGVNIPVAWAFAITDYVWWIGIGMAGTFTSAALYLTRQPWRSPLNRYAESMTVFAVSVSGLFPILHLGRPWFFYWLMPYPNRMGVWPQWRSALTWDFFAILAYLLVSLMYWYVGLVPDLATLRDRASTRLKQVGYGLLALGWRGEARHWQRHRTLSTVLAGLAVPLVFSVHSMVGLDFSEGLLPGWHSTLFPPFFVAGALFSGFAMALVLGVPLCHWFGLHDYIRATHFDHLAKLVLAAGLVVDYGYAVEAFMACYSGDHHELAALQARIGGPYAWVFWTVVACNALTIQVLWWRRARRCRPLLVVVGLVVLAGMWLERFMLIVDSLSRGFLPSSDGLFRPTGWDFGFLAGSVGLFLLLFLLFVRWLPVLSMFELRELAHREGRP